MAEDTQSHQGGNLNETVQQVQQGTVQQQQESLIERKGYGPLVDPALDAFPLHYRSPYIPGPVIGFLFQATGSFSPAFGSILFFSAMAITASLLANRTVAQEAVSEANIQVDASAR